MNPAKFRKMTPYLILALGLAMLVYFSSMARPAKPQQPQLPQTTAAPETTAAQETTEVSVPQPPTLEDLYGEDYAQLLSQTVLMQMENRMGKPPHVPYFPITENLPLENYVQIGPGTEFTLEEDGSVTLTFLSGSVAPEEHGPQSFRIPKQ